MNQLQRIRHRFVVRLGQRLIAKALGTGKPPDFVIGEATRPYMLRWWKIPRNRFFNIYLHCVLRDDDDRALHDHPWQWISIILQGSYREVTAAKDGTMIETIHRVGSIRFHRARFAHRLALVDGEPCWTLFLTGPRIRQWGFHCPQGWVHWRRFTDPATDGATVGRGCGEG